mmetsp:Transcript_30247/g.62153  ORF Transcript_30247/g.62153 Transcript_30247/m.62153 type:complete len:260 (-) Transcript_30247:520-1299(-)
MRRRKQKLLRNPRWLLPIVDAHPLHEIGIVQHSVHIQFRRTFRGRRRGHYGRKSRSVGRTGRGALDAVFPIAISHFGVEECPGAAGEESALFPRDAVDVFGAARLGGITRVVRWTSVGNHYAGAALVFALVMFSLLLALSRVGIVRNLGPHLQRLANEPIAQVVGATSAHDIELHPARAVSHAHPPARHLPPDAVDVSPAQRGGDAARVPRGAEGAQSAVFLDGLDVDFDSRFGVRRGIGEVLAEDGLFRHARHVHRVE